MPGDVLRQQPEFSLSRQLTRPPGLSEISHRLLAETYTPAAVLVDREHRILYATGPIERYLQLFPGRPVQDLLHAAPMELRGRLRAALQEGFRENKPLTITGGLIELSGAPRPYRIDLLNVPHHPGALQLVCFVASPTQPDPALEQELQPVREQLQNLLHSLEFSETSTAPRQAASNISGNILETIEIGVLLLDQSLNIRFFNAATAPLFNLLPGDIGRPLSALTPDTDPLLITDAAAMLKTPRKMAREIETSDGRRFLRRLSPYQDDTGMPAGLAVTFSEIPPPEALSAPAANLLAHTGGDLLRLLNQTAGALSCMMHGLAPSRRAAPPALHAVPPPEKEKADHARRIACLTQRERQIMKMVVAGRPSKTIATDLGISQRTVENHRAAIMRKTSSKSLPALARLAFASGLSDIAEPS